MKLKVRVPASSANLGPGFDVLGVALKLYNEIEVEILKNKKEKGSVVISGEGLGFLPSNANNLVLKAMTEVFIKSVGKNWKHKYSFSNYKIKLNNNIPIGSGMGSSAAAYLCGILAANEIVGRKLSTDDIISLGVKHEGHSDNVIPALLGGLCISISNDPKLKYLKLESPQIKAVVANPDFQLPTRKSRKVLPNKVSLKSAVFNCERIALLISAFQNKQYGLLSFAMQDKLHQPYREKLIPGMKKVFKAALESGAYGVALSGSGPSIVSFCQKGKAKKIGENIKNTWKKLKVNSKYFILDFDKEGARVWR